MRSDAPFIAWGRASKVVPTLKNPRRAGHRPRDPIEIAERRACAWASTLTAQSLAASRAASIGDFLAERLPLWWRSASLPSGPSGSWPEKRTGEFPGANGRNVVGDGRGGFGKNDPELLETCRGLAPFGDGLLSRPRPGRRRRGVSRPSRRHSEGKLVFCPLARLGLRPMRGCAGGFSGRAARNGMTAMGRSFSIWHWMLFGAVALLLFGGKGRIS